MKLNKTKITFKIIKLIRDLKPEEWSKVKVVVDDMYFGLRMLENRNEEPSDDIEEIEDKLEGDE